MRTLNKNKQTFWTVYPVSTNEVMDDEGNYTGEYEIEYSEPEEIHLHIYPSNADIVNRLFGKDESIDFIGVSTMEENLYLEPNSLIIGNPKYNQNKNYGDTYRYRVSAMSNSKNVINYGLVSRV